MKKKCVLSIAGSDSGAGAGIQADLKTVTACGGYCTTAITAITAQNTVKVNSVEIISDNMVKAQIDAIMKDFNITAIKIGMVPSKGIVEIIENTIKKYNIKNVVLDPVMIATSGDLLVSKDVAEIIIEKLLPLCSVITPNIPEAEFISKIDIKSENNFSEIADFFKQKKCKSLLLKAGHLDSEILTDYLYDFEHGITTKHSYRKIKTPNTHGTGCTLSSSIAAFLSNGENIQQAVQKAEVYLHNTIETANYIIGDGHGPVNHFYMLENE